MNNKKTVYQLGDLAAKAQAAIQANFSQINPVVNISHKLREQGFAADTLTIEHQPSDKRLLMVVHDNSQSVDVEWGALSKDPAMDFTSWPTSLITEQQFYQWMSEL